MKNESFKDFVLDQLIEVCGVTCRPMFGGYGLYRKDVFFGIIHKGRLYLKTDERTQSLYLAKGMTPFRPNAKQTLRSYYEIPVDILENAEQLAEWAHQACRPSIT